MLSFKSQLYFRLHIEFSMDAIHVRYRSITILGLDQRENVGPNLWVDGHLPLCNKPINLICGSPPNSLPIIRLLASPRPEKSPRHIFQPNKSVRWSRPSRCVQCSYGEINFFTTTTSQTSNSRTTRSQSTDESITDCVWCETARRRVGALIIRCVSTNNCG